ncbi:MAG: CHASE2 domain-containing protein [Desulfocucumaceae bacterium]
MNLNRIISRFGVAAAIFLTVTALAMAGLFERYENIIYDSWFSLKGKIPPGEKVVIVGIDDASVGKIGNSIPRSTHGRLLEQLREAGIVGFDVQFEAKGQPEEDQSFAQAIKKHGRVVLACSFNFGRDQQGNVDTGLIMPFRPFLAACRGVGFINMNTDMDNTVRRIMPAAEYGKHIAPSFSLAVTLLSLELDPNRLSFEGGSLKAGGGGFSIPLDRQKPYHLINFWGPHGSFKTYSYADVLEGKYSPETFRDKIVLVGPTSPFFHDYFNIPYTRSNMILQNNLPTPGVEIHAAAINTFLNSAHFTRAGWQVNLLILLLAGVISYLTTYRRGPWVGLGGFLAAVAVFSVFVYLTWLYRHYWINLAGPLVLIVFTYIGITTENFVREQMEKKRTRIIFGRYVSPQVVDQLLDQPEMMGLGGKRENLTLLFSDIRGFTTFSDRRPPEEVVAKLNQYLTEMTTVIFKNGGTLDKYMGDGIMAFFGAPIPYPDHAERAVKTGLEMLVELEKLNRTWEDRGEATLGIGVGISTGHVVVGNIGSPERMDYTAIGGDVNLAARLESLTKEFKTRIIISGGTYSQLEKDRPGRTFTHLGAVPVRGFEQPVEIYTVTGENSELRTQNSE